MTGRKSQNLIGNTEVAISKGKFIDYFSYNTGSQTAIYELGRGETPQKITCITSTIYGTGAWSSVSMTVEAIFKDGTSRQFYSQGRDQNVTVLLSTKLSAEEINELQAISATVSVSCHGRPDWARGSCEIFITEENWQ